MASQGRKETDPADATRQPGEEGNYYTGGNRGMVHMNEPGQHPGHLSDDPTRYEGAFGSPTDDSWFDSDYQRWREEQLRRFDDDYRRWRQERFQRFSSEFTQWRQGREGGFQEGALVSAGAVAAEASSEQTAAGAAAPLSEPALAAATGPHGPVVSEADPTSNAG